MRVGLGWVGRLGLAEHLAEAREEVVGWLPTSGMKPGDGGGGKANIGGAGR